MNAETERRWVGLRLRHIRELADVSREQMAKALGVTPGAVGHWESGRSVPNGRQLAIWARATGIPIDLLYRETGLLDDDEPVPAGLHGWYRARQSAPVPAAEGTGNLPDNRRGAAPVRTVRGEVIRKDDADQDGVIESYPAPAVRELALASR